MRRPFNFLTLCLVAAAVAAGCSSNPGTNDGGLDATTEGGDVCSSPFTGVGNPCPHVSAALCFPECTTGGCKCVASPTGPVWQCTTDTSCMPCAGPLDDGSADCGSDGAVTEAGQDGGADADDAAADSSDAAQD